MRLIGVAPMHYLANWRMQVATQKLQHQRSLAQVAETVGYDSEAAFSRAFKKAFGVAPATWRRSNSYRHDLPRVASGISDEIPAGP